MKESWDCVIKALPNIIWGLLWITTSLIVLVKVAKPIIELLITNRKETNLMNLRFQQEQYWYTQKQIEKKLQDLLNEKVTFLDEARKVAEKDKKTTEIEQQRIESELQWCKSLLKQIQDLKLPKNN